MKYLRTENQGFVIFSDHTIHADMARVLGCGEDNIVVSAGFVRLHDDGEIECYGEATSMKIGSKPDDSENLTRRLKA